MILVFLCQAPASSAQESRFHTYFKLSTPERKWVRHHLFVAGKAWKITKEAKQAAREMAQSPLLDHDTAGGQVDAFRHAYWMARLSQEIALKKVQKLGEAHEEGNYLNFLKGKPENGQLPDSISSVMDRWNNKIGQQLGTRYPKMPPDSLSMLVVTSILNGEMRVIFKNEKGEALRCNGFPAGEEYRHGRWQVPKCLLESNYRADPRRK